MESHADYAEDYAIAVTKGGAIAAPAIDRDLKLRALFGSWHVSALARQAHSSHPGPRLTFWRKYCIMKTSEWCVRRFDVQSTGSHADSPIFSSRVGLPRRRLVAFRQRCLGKYRENTITYDKSPPAKTCRSPAGNLPSTCPSPARNLRVTCPDPARDQPKPATRRAGRAQPARHRIYGELRCSLAGLTPSSETVDLRYSGCGVCGPPPGGPQGCG